MEWIDAKETLPPLPEKYSEVRVLASLSLNQKYRVMELVYNSAGHFMIANSDTDVTNIVTHWMPLPKPFIL